MWARTPITEVRAERGLEGPTVLLGSVGSGGLTSRLDLCSHSMNLATLRLNEHGLLGGTSTPNGGTVQQDAGMRKAQREM